MTVFQGTREGNYQCQQLESNHTVNMRLNMKQDDMKKEDITNKRKFHYRTLKG